MKSEDKKIIYEAIAKHGDGFWSEGNRSLIDEVDVMLMKEGYELVVRKVGKR